MIDTYLVLAACALGITALAVVMILKGVAVGREYYSEVED